MREVFERAEFLAFFQGAFHAAFPAQYRQFSGEAAPGDVGVFDGAFAADFPAADQAVVRALPGVDPGEGRAQCEVDRAVDNAAHSASLAGCFCWGKAVSRVRCY
ncbi:hypothetical protein D3C80_1601810 [compost metagenome]